MENFNQSSPYPLETRDHLPQVTRPAKYVAVPGTAYDAYDNEDSSTGILEYWRMFRRHKKTIILLAIIGLIIGVLVSIPMTPLYRAGSSLEVLNVNEDFMNMKQSSPVTTTDNSYDTSEEQTQAKLMQSEGVVQLALASLAADPQVADRKTPPTSWRSWLRRPSYFRANSRQELLAAAAASLKVSTTPKTRLLSVSAVSADPKIAAAFVNKLIEVFIQNNMESRWQVTKRTGEWLGGELAEERANLRKAEDALQAYARQSGLIYTDNESSVAVERLQQVQEQLSGATADRIAKQSRFQLAKTSPPDSLADILNDPGLRQKSLEIEDLRKQLADLKALYNPQYIKVQRVQAQLDELQTSLERDRQNVLARIENDYMEASNREKLLAAAFDDQTRLVSGQDEKTIQYNILKRDVESNRQLYDTMLLQLKQSSIAAALRASNIRVVEPARIPNSPFFPNYKINALVGMALGFLIGLAGIIVQERSDRTLQQPGDVKLWTGMHELGAIPSAKSLDKVAYYSVARANASSMRTLTSPNGRESVELVTWEHKPGVMAESFRSALTSVLFVAENGSRPRVLVFTSAQPSEGKTTVVSNLALAMAEIRRKVLIIDADLRRPRMHSIFNLPNEQGLGSLLRDDLTEGDVAAMIQPTTFGGLHVLTAGPATSSAANLLHSHNFLQLLTALRKQYDMVLIDMPPALQIPDARVVGRLADAVVLVARANRTTRDALIAVRERFEEDRIPVIGTILNDWNPQSARGGYYGNYKDPYAEYKAKYYDNRTTRNA